MGLTPPPFRNILDNCLRYFLKSSLMLLQRVYHFWASEVCWPTDSIKISIPESRALIVGSEDLYIHEGSPVSLQCKVVDSAGPPAYIYWYKGDKVINYSNQKHIEISYSSLKTSPVSTLLIKVNEIFCIWCSKDKLCYFQHATPLDSGNYTCAPANYRQHSVVVNVIKGTQQKRNPEKLQKVLKRCI